MSNQQDLKKKKLSPNAYYSDDCVVCSLHNHAQHELYANLLDMGRVENWWPDWVEFSVNKVTEEGVGSELSIETQLGNVDLEITEAEAPNEITYTYKGAMKGEVTWTLEKESENRTKVCYWMDLYPGSFALRPVVPLFGIPYIKSCLSDIALHLEKHLDNNPTETIEPNVAMDAVSKNVPVVQDEVETITEPVSEAQNDPEEHIYDEEPTTPMFGDNMDDVLILDPSTPWEPSMGVTHTLEPYSFITRPYIAAFIGFAFPRMYKASLYRGLLRNFKWFTRNRSL